MCLLDCFFYINNESYFPAENEELIAHYTGNGDWQTLTFNMSNHKKWTDTITALRFDPVHMPNTSFEIDWIKGICTNCTTARRTTTQSFRQLPSESKVSIYPNPLGEQLFIKGIGEGTIVRIF